LNWQPRLSEKINAFFRFDIFLLFPYFPKLYNNLKPFTLAGLEGSFYFKAVSMTIAPRRRSIRRIIVKSSRLWFPGRGPTGSFDQSGCPLKSRLPKCRLYLSPTWQHPAHMGWVIAK
jgi:hypothetical protein